jgi:hypothetical protein
MSANLEPAILEKLRTLPDTKQREVLAMVEALSDKDRVVEPGATRQSIGEIFEELNSRIPFEEWAELPSDGAEQHDRYLYGQRTPNF